MKHTGQTGRPFKVRFQEHVRDFKYNNNRSKFAQHLIQNKHAIGKMKDIMEVVHVTKKGKILDTLEGFHIYKETKAGNQSNDRITVRENAIFETMVHTRRRYGFGGLGVACWPLVPKFAGSNPSDF